MADGQGNVGAPGPRMAAGVAAAAPAAGNAAAAAGPAAAPPQPLFDIEAGLAVGSPPRTSNTAFEIHAKF